jgi:hypothetical protein
LVKLLTRDPKFVGSNPATAATGCRLACEWAEGFESDKRSSLFLQRLDGQSKQFGRKGQGINFKLWRENNDCNADVVRLVY